MEGGRRARTLWPATVSTRCADIGIQHAGPLDKEAVALTTVTRSLVNDPHFRVACGNGLPNADTPDALAFIGAFLS
jgi:hypothetical protein